MSETAEGMKKVAKYSNEEMVEDLRRRNRELNKELATVRDENKVLKEGLAEVQKDIGNHFLVERSESPHLYFVFEGELWRIDDSDMDLPDEFRLLDFLEATLKIARRIIKRSRSHVGSVTG